MRWAARNQVRLVRAMHANDAAARPVGQLVRVGSGAEREWSIDGTEALQLLADPVRAAGRRSRRLTNTDGCLKDLLAALEELKLERAAVDDELRVDQVELA